MENVKQYKNYIFDLYGTLVDIHTEEQKDSLWEALAGFYGEHGAIYTKEELKQTYENLVKEKEATYSHEAYPEVQLELVFQAMFLKKGIFADLSLSIEAGRKFRTLSTEYIRLYDGAKQLLQSLREQKKGVYLLSNAQEIFTMPELEQLGIKELFDGIFISSTKGCKKPEQKFFEMLFEQYDLEKDTCLMIGNDENTDIFGANQVGIDSFYIHSNLSPEWTGTIKSTYHLDKMDLPYLTRCLI